MTTFTKPQLRAVRTAMEEALNKIQNEKISSGNGLPFKLGRDISFRVGNCTYNGGEATFKVEVLLDGAETKEQKDLTQMARLMGLDTSKIKDTQGMSFSLVGYNSKARKMPWIVQDLKTNKTYKLSDQQAELFFKKVEEVV